MNRDEAIDKAHFLWAEAHSKKHLERMPSVDELQRLGIVPFAAGFDSGAAFEAERAKALLEALSHINHILNWNADHICRCYTEVHPNRNPDCQYHAASDVIQNAWAAFRGEK